MVLSGRGSASPHGRGTLPLPTGVPLPPRQCQLFPRCGCPHPVGSAPSPCVLGRRRSTPEDVCSTLGRESESRKRKAAVVPTQSDCLLMGNEGNFHVSNEESYRISKEIENLRSQLALKKKELNYQQNKKLRVQLDLKVEEVECLRKENEELKSQNKDFQNNNKELQDRNDDLTKQNEELQAKNDDLHKNVKIEDGEKQKLEKVLRATKAIWEAISAEKETAEESLKVVQAELEANKSSLAQSLSDRDYAHQATGKMKEDITELMNEAGIISASFVLAVFKDHYPDLDVLVINKGFKRGAAKSQELIESFKDLVQPAAKQLEFSYWSDDEGSLSSYELGSDAQ